MKNESDKFMKCKKTVKTLKIIAIILLILLIFIGGAIGYRLIKTEKTEKQYASFLEDGEKYLLALDYEKAEDAYLNAIDIDPKKAKPYVQLAEVYKKQERYEDAKEILYAAKENVVLDKETCTKEEKENFDLIDKELEELDVESKFAWVVEPTIEADDIFYLANNPDDGFSINAASKQGENPNAVIQVGDQYGIITPDGSLMAEPEYKKVYNCGDRYLIVRTIPKYELEYETEWEYYWLDNDGTMHAGMGFGDVSGVFYYYHDGVRQINGHSYGDLKDDIIPVQNAPQVYSEYDAACFKLDSKYAIEYNGNLLTDFIYDECGSQADGLFAVCQNGKWGYVDKKGEVIIPLEYDPSWNQYPIIDKWLRSTQETKPYCYAFSEGYVPLVKDGKWEMRDSKGNMVIPAGVFEAIRPVYQGKCWVKKDGKWGVIAIEQNQEEEQPQLSYNEMEKYQDILDKYEKMIREDWDLEKILEEGFSEIYADESKADLGYALMDINGDEIKELFIGISGRQQDGYFYELYTILDNNAVLVTQTMYRYHNYLCDNYMIENSSSDGWDVSESSYYKLLPHSVKLEQLETGENNLYNYQEITYQPII